MVFSVHGGRNTQSRPGVLPELLRSLKDANVCMAALDEVRGHLGERIHVLRNACTPLVLEHGIKTMPDEILSLIFEAGHRLTSGCTFSKRISHVSRRFRRVSLGTPILWSRLLAVYTHTQVETFLERSGQVDLEVSMMVPFHDVAGTASSLFQTMRPHSNRWSSLALGGGVHNVIPKIGLICLPRLQYLYHDCPINFSSWQAPMLRQINWRCEGIPSGFAFHSQLTSLDLLFWTDTVDLASLARVLHSAANLRELHVTLDNCRVDDGPIIGVTEIPHRHSVPIDILAVTIKNLTTLVFTSRLYDTLLFLSPSRMELTLENLADDGIDDANSSFLYDSGFNLFPYGSTIHIRILNVLCYTGVLDECTILAELALDSNAETIHIEAPMTPFTWSYDLHDVKDTFSSSLRHLQFTRCDRLSEEDVTKLVTLFMDVEAPSKLESLEIHHCRGISEEFLLDLCQDPKVGETLRWTL